MRRLLLLLGLIFLLVPSYWSQSTGIQSDNTDVALKKIWLLSDLQNLESDSVKLDKPLPRAVAKTEIADAAWSLDQAWAKKLLREAYELTFPDEEEQAQLRSKPVGAAVTLPSNTDMIREEIRNRILNVASHDKAFTNQLAQLSAQHLGRQEEERRYANLAFQATKAGDTELASKYIAQAFNADPTLINISLSILDVAIKDRAAADNLIIQYIERLRGVQLSLADQSAFRVYAHLYNLVFPSPTMAQQRGGIIPPTGAIALKAYVSYIIESLAKLEQAIPGSAKMFRHFLLSTWLPLKQYAPELYGSFVELEKVSRGPGENTALPQENNRGTSNTDYERVIKDALDSGHPSDFAFISAFGREDFGSIRKMIDLLPDGEQKRRHLEFVNLRETLSLINKGDTLSAERLAEQLKQSTSIQQAYSVMIVKCVAKKDTFCAGLMARQAMKQLRSAEDQSQVPLSFSTLAKSVASIDEILALEMLDEAVRSANSGSVDTSQGQIGLEIDAFKVLAAKNDVRTYQAAINLKDRLQRISALTSINKWKAIELTKSEKAQRRLE
jgi:hypothetical protein